MKVFERNLLVLSLFLMCLVFAGCGADGGVKVEVKQPTIEAEAVDLDAISYKDGEYNQKGRYVTPGGDEEIEVKIVLKDGVIVDAGFSGNTQVPASIKFQGLFNEGYKEVVIGKRIENLFLDKVSGSSLTPKGFMEAVGKVRVEAQV